MSRSMGMDAFLGHQTRSGNTGHFLRGWRKRNPAQVDVVLHQKAPIVALWQHGLPRIYEQKDEKTGNTTRRVFGGSFNCLEDESVLLKQYRRDRNTGERVLPPVVCPVCRLMEALHILYTEGSIGFADTIFRWEGDDPNETQVLTLGGMLNLYGKDNLTDPEKDAMKAAGISLKESWKENTWGKCNYLFVVVDVDEPEHGVQLAIETTALGDATKECIHGQITSMGEEDGNPMVNPYAIRWEHHPNAKEFSKKYKAIAMPRITITAQVDELINSDPPDIENVVKPGNVTKLRADLEAHCVLDDPSIIPWDEIFGPAERAGYGDDDADEEVGQEAEEEAAAATQAMAAKRKPAAAKPATKEETKAAPAAAAAPTGRRRKKPEPEPEPEVEEEEEASHEDGTQPCDECGAAMAADATKCEACGAEYEMDDEDEEEVEEEEPPPAKAAAKPPAAKPAAAKPAAAKPPAAKPPAAKPPAAKPPAATAAKGTKKLPF